MEHITRASHWLSIVKQCSGNSLRTLARYDYHSMSDLDPEIIQ